MEPIVASIKGVTIGLYILPGNRQAWPCVRYQSTGTGKATINRHHSNTSGVANKQKLFDERRYGGIILIIK